MWMKVKRIQSLYYNTLKSFTVMKKSCILLSVFMLMLPQMMCGQGTRYSGLKALYEVFDKITSTESVSIASDKKEASAINDRSEVLDSLSEEITYIKVLKNDFGLLDELKTAFLIEDDHKTSVYTCFGPLDEAVITRGGIDVKEISPGSMQSKIINNLYFAGEVMDVDALTGGFNLQIAFSTGYLAGKSAANN